MQSKRRIVSQALHSLPRRREAWTPTMTCSPLFSKDYPEVISVQPSRTHRTTTTQSWDFLGLNYQKPSAGSGLLDGSKYGDDVIIGVVDTGSAVEAASFHGLAEGVARGGAPHARIAVYKSAWGAGGVVHTAPVLAAIDDAIHDGVDVLSLSLTDMGENSFGALHAVQKGITVVYAGGNSGPRPQTIQNTSPWVITVAASKIDRSFPTMITLGNKQKIVGQSLYYQAKNSSRGSFASIVVGVVCTAEGLNGTEVQGKILLCLPIQPRDQDVLTPLRTFMQAAQYVLDGKGSGLIFAQGTIGQSCPLINVTIGLCKSVAPLPVQPPWGGRGSWTPKRPSPPRLTNNAYHGHCGHETRYGPSWHFPFHRDGIGPYLPSLKLHDSGPIPD
ncbi:Subtilisin-like protease [Triticum urartu]|uniref:Subtilisin-like protease n=1 Tax=Triticum urartu TaxID=4572 RepID=M7ZEC2_TRIUA|nr:Subtilisin-like protease [Triticum urartu]